MLYLAFIIVQFAFSLLQQNCKKCLGLILLVTDLRVKDESVAGGREGEGDNANCSRSEATCSVH